MKLKADVGESGDAESIRKTVEVLELHAVQHGISAATSR
jgi:adenosine deaminase